ncbi:MAG: hypothetical protein ACREEW_05615 [Caulobacteraceae bacterium]
MPDALDREIEAYERLVPAIKKKVGAAWVVVADQQLVKAFPTFADAAKYARERFGEREVLIRHTDERKTETVPFVHARSAG